MPETSVSDEVLSERLQKGDVDETWRLVLKPDWRLRSDEKRVLMLQAKREIGELSTHSVLHPNSAIVLALLDGDRALREVYTQASSLFELPVQYVKESLVKPLFSRFPDSFRLRRGDRSHQVYDPAHFVIPAAQIDMTTTKLYRPAMIILHIADTCMRNCIYCNVQKRAAGRNGALSTEQILDVIDQADELGVVAISIAGGDPFVRKDIPEIMERIILYDMAHLVSTKAHVSEKMAGRLRDVGVEIVQVSLDAPTKETADLLTGSVGFFEEAIQSIKNLRSAGIRVRTNSILTPFNARMAPQLIDLLASLGVYSIGFNSYARSLHNGALADSLFINHRDGKWLEEKVAECQEKYPNMQIASFSFPIDKGFQSPRFREQAFRARAHCSAGRTAFVMREDGTVVLCEECPIIEELVIGNVKEHSIEELWNSPKIREITHPPREKYEGTVCFDCPDFDECHDGKGRCWRGSLKAYGKLYAPDPGCPKAPKGKRIA